MPTFLDESLMNPVTSLEQYKEAEEVFVVMFVTKVNLPGMEVKAIGCLDWSVVKFVNQQRLHENKYPQLSKYPTLTI